jgi:2-keto-4-pentenoate hydratase
METSLAEAAAGWLAEAVETGNPLAPLPADALPATVAEGQRIAALVLERLRLVPCGLRLALGPDGRMVPGPVLEGRLLPDGASIALAALRHSGVAPAMLGVLAEELPAQGEAPPHFAALHPALDIASWRLRDPPGEAALAAADLAGLGLLVVGRAKPGEPARCRLGFGPVGARRRGVEVDLPAALRAAAQVARDAGGLPRGAVLVAPLGPPMALQPGMEVSAAFAGFGRVRARFL